jgi:hypothetical protein
MRYAEIIALKGSLRLADLESGSRIYREDDADRIDQMKVAADQQETRADRLKAQADIADLKQRLSDKQKGLRAVNAG